MQVGVLCNFNFREHNFMDSVEKFVLAIAAAMLVFGIYSLVSLQ
jgi:hypothetical protein